MVCCLKMEEKLIEFIRENEFLYNKRNRNHKNILLREKKFKELSDKINVPAKKLKERWRTLKDKFYREIKMGERPCRTGAIFTKKKWNWLEHLMFLKEGTDFSNENTSSDLPKDECSYLSFTEDFTLPSSSFRLSTPPSSAYKIEVDDSDFANVSKVPTQRTKEGSAFEDMLKEAKEEISEMVLLAKEAFPNPEPERTMAQHFFDGLARQTDEANLSPKEFFRLQVKMLECLSSILYPSEK